MERILLFCILTLGAALFSLICTLYNKRFKVFPWINNFNPNVILVFSVYFVILEAGIVAFILKMN